VKRLGNAIGLLLLAPLVMFGATMLLLFFVMRFVALAVIGIPTGLVLVVWIGSAFAWMLNPFDMHLLTNFLGFGAWAALGIGLCILIGYPWLLFPQPKPGPIGDKFWEMR